MKHSEKHPNDNPDVLYSLLENVKDKANQGLDILKEAKENPLVDKFRIQMVPFHLLRVTEYQSGKFSWNHVKGINEEYHPALTRCSSVLYYKGEYICWEGQHTAVLNWLNGMKAVPCVVFEDDNMDFKDIPTISKFDRGELMTLFGYIIEDAQPESIQDLIDYCNDDGKQNKNK